MYKNDVSKLFDDLQFAINNPNVYITLTEKYIYSDELDENAVTVSPNIRNDFDEETINKINEVLRKHRMPVI